MTEAMKDSKTRWLGQIPADWDMVRVKDCFDRKNKKANQKDPIVLSLARSGVKIRDISSNEGQLAADYTNYNPVAKDDVLINPMDLVSGDNCNISRVEGVISPAYVNLRYKKGINPRFYNYYFKLQYWLGAFFAHGFGVSFDNRWTLSYETLSKYPLVLPPSDEQDKIADFLDEKCAEIDQLSEDIQKQIDILEEYKKSVITRVVTKGLNPNTEMKDSGIQWIGKMNSAFARKKIKNACSMIGSGTTPQSSNTEFYNDGSINWIQSGDIYGKEEITDVAVKVTPMALHASSSLKVYKTPFIVIAMYGGSVGNTAISRINACTNQAVCCLKPNSDTNLKYLYYWIQFCKEDFLVKAEGGGQPNISQDKIRNQWILLPDIDEQEKIVAYLDKICDEINDSIATKRQQIENLDTYKKSIIYEYVTGKKRVA